MIRPATKVVVEILSFLVLALVLVSGLFVWRLSRGPLVLDFLTPTIERSLNAPDAAFRIAIADTELTWTGGAHLFELRARGVRAIDRSGRVVAGVPALGISFDFKRLVAGTLAPVRIDLVQPHLRILRAEDGSLAITDDAAAADAPQEAGERPEQALLDALRRPPGQGSGPMAELREVSVTDGVISLTDRRNGKTLLMPRADIVLRRGAGTITGAAGLDLRLGEGLVRLSSTLRYDIGRDRLAVDAAVSGLRVADLAAAVPELTPLGAAALTLNGTVRAEFAPGFVPAVLAVDVTGRDGLLTLPQFYAQKLALPWIRLKGRLDVAGGRLEVSELAADLGGPALQASGSFVDSGGLIAADVDAQVGQVTMDQLSRLWPMGVAPNPREWILANLSKGTVDRTRVKAAFRLPLARPQDAALTSLDGQADFHGFDVHYFADLPEVTDVAGSAHIGPSQLDLDLAGGRLRDVTLGRSAITITGLDVKDQSIDITVPVSGPLKTMLSVLDLPPLGYPAKLGLNPAHVGGKADGQLHFAFPLEQKLKVEQVQVSAKAKVTGLTLPDVVPRLPVTAGAMSLTLDTKHLSAEGTARLAEIPATVAWQENFSHKAEFETRITARATVGEADRTRLGVELAPWVGGPVAVNATYLVPKPGQGRLSAELGLKTATLAVAPIGWSKPAGTAGQARFDLQFAGGQAVRVPAFSLSAAGLGVRGHLDLAPGLQPTRIVLDEAALGQTRVKADVSRLASGGWAVALDGPSLDLQPLLGDKDKAAGNDQRKSPHQAVASRRGHGPGVPVRLKLQLGRVLIGSDRVLRDVAGELSNDGRQWLSAALDARVGAATSVTLRYQPDGAVRRLKLETADAGAALRALDVYDTMLGGQLVIDGTTKADDPGAPLVGTITLSHFTLIHAPVLARLLNAMSISGLSELLGGKGIAFDKMSGDWRWQNDQIKVSELHTAGAALGLTARGLVKLDDETVDFQGTIVPVAGVNQLLGSVPLLGDLLTGGKGQGLFAFTYTVKGPLDDPSISVNPLAVLAPGFLRNLFFLGPAPGSPPPPPPPPPPRHND